MAGIFIHFNPEGISPSDRENFSKQLASRTTCMPDGVEVKTEGPHWIGASIHHGVLPSGGIATEPGSQLLASGSCWIRPADVTLASPMEILKEFNSNPSDKRPAFGGTFALAYCDERNRELTVETDRFEAMPLYYRERAGGIIISSEIKFLAEPGSDTIDRDALAEFMSLGYLPSSWTLLSGVLRIPANARLVFNDRGCRISIFPTPGYPRNRVADTDAISEYDFLVRKFMQRFRDHAPSHSISLSGGLDSRILAAAALDDGFPLEAFTIGEKGSLDAKVAVQVAEQFGIPIKVHNVDGSLLPRYLEKTVWFTEGRVVPGHMHYMSANFMGEVPDGPQFHGLGGECVMGGHLDNPALQGATPQAIRKACMKAALGLNYMSPTRSSELFSTDLSKRVKVAKTLAVETLFKQMGFSGSYSDFVEFRYRFRMEAFSNPCLMTQVLPWTDVICPFLDSEAFDFGASLELEGIANRLGQIRWGLDHYPAIAKLPRIKAGVMVDIRDDDPFAYDRGVRRIILEKKIQFYICRLSQGRINIPIRKSFPNYGQWYRRWGSVRDFVDGILLSEQALDRGLFNRKGMKNLLNDCRVGRETWGTIGTLLVVEIFLRQMTEGTNIPKESRIPMGLED